MFVSSGVGQRGDQVRLLSPVSTFSANTKLTFYYYMHLNDSDTTAALTLFQYTDMHVYNQRLFVAKGNQGSTWKQATVCLPEGTYQLASVATLGMPYLTLLL
jgi:hypothetical protein